jgi:hypothetical protein
MKYFALAAKRKKKDITSNALAPGQISIGLQRLLIKTRKRYRAPERRHTCLVAIRGIILVGPYEYRKLFICCFRIFFGFFFW